MLCLKIRKIKNEESQNSSAQYAAKFMKIGYFCLLVLFSSFIVYLDYFCCCKLRMEKKKKEREKAFDYVFVIGK